MLFCFNVSVSKDLQKLAQQLDVRIHTGKVIYRLLHTLKVISLAESRGKISVKILQTGFFQGFFRAVKRPQKLNLELSFETQSSHQSFSAVKMKLFELNS